MIEDWKLRQMKATILRQRKEIAQQEAQIKRERRESQNRAREVQELQRERLPQPASGRVL